MKKIIIFIFLIMEVNAFGANLIAIASGSWMSNATWNCTCTPTNADNVFIPAGINVTLPTVFNPMNLGPSISILVQGTLTLSSTNLILDASDVFRVDIGGAVVGAGLGGFVTSVSLPPYVLTVASGATDPGPFTIIAGILPISLMYFKASENNSFVTLSWATASETNLDHYSVERSSDGKEFSVLTTITAEGNSTAEKHYSVADEHSLNGISYYRLTETDLDGKTTIFNEVSINCISKNSLSVYPNPITDKKLTFELNFEPASTDYYVLKRSDGGVVSSSLLQKNSNEFILSESVISGVYFLQIFSSKAVLIQRIVIP